MIKITIFKTENNIRFIKRFRRATKLLKLKFREKRFFIKPSKRKEMRF